MSELGPAESYTEGEGIPIVWYVDFSSPTGWVEPRDMGWIPKLQAGIDEARRKRLEAEQPDFAAWEAEIADGS